MYVSIVSITYEKNYIYILLIYIGRICFGAGS